MVPSDDDDTWQKYSLTVKPLISKDRAISPIFLPRNRFPRMIQTSLQQSLFSLNTYSIDLSSNIRVEKLNKNLKKSPIDAILDLHGEIIKNAHPILIRFIEKAIHFDHRIILVITGKSLNKAVTHELRLVKLVPIWLKSPPLNQYVKKVTYAKREHGGEGAFYVFLKPFT